MPSCPACGRNVAVARAECLYCGARLADEALARSAEAATAAPAVERSRLLVLLDLAATTPAVISAALALSRYEAELLGRRGGPHLVRAASPEDAEAEAGRLRAAGAAPLLVPEAEVRVPPLVCLEAELRGDELVLRTSEGAAALARGATLLVVRGAITREYQPTPKPRRIATARLAEGFRVHLHRRGEARPLEIDALNLETGFAASGSLRLEIDAWLQAVAGDAPRDDGFARLPPVLGPAAPEPKGPLGALGSLGAAGRGAGGQPPLVLDNLEQFRFYSGCLAALARRR